MTLRRLQLFGVVFLAVALASAPANAMPFLIPFIPLLVAAAAYGAGFITLTAFLVTLATAALSFAAQMLLKPSAAQPQTQLSGSGGGTPAIDQKQTIRQPAAVRKFLYGRSRVGGIFVYLFVTDNNAFLRGAIAFLGHECEEIEQIIIADEVSPTDPGTGYVNAGRYTDAAYFNKHLGADDQAADTNLVNNSGGNWTAAYRLRGITYLGFGLIWDNLGGDGTVGLNLWSGGIPNITIVAKGKKVYDPRDGGQDPADRSTWLYSNNSALCVADYLCDSVVGLGVDYATGINEEALIAAANACDEDMERPDGSTEKRYTTDGVFASDSKPDEILGRLLGAMAGKAIYDGEQWTIYAGVYQTPEITLTDDDMRAMSKVQVLSSTRDSFNGVKGVYVGESNDWQAADFPPVLSAAYKAEDGGIEQLKDIELPFTVSPGRAQRIAKVDLVRGRQELTEQFFGKLSCWRIRTGDTILRTSPRYGWTDKPFEVASCAFGVDEDPEGNQILGIDLVLREVSPDAYDWTADEESEVDPAPNTDFPSVFDVLPPSNLRVTEENYADSEGAGVKTKFTLAWDASEDSFVKTGGTYHARYRLQGATVWTPIFVPDPRQLTATAFDVSPGLYEAEVRAINWAGNPSDALPLMFEVIGVGDIPADPTGFSVSAHDSVARASYDLAPELDVRRGGYNVIKHSPVTDGSATWEEALVMDGDIPGDTRQWMLPLVSGTYLLKRLDAAGNFSEGFAAFVQFQSSVHTFNAIDATIQDPGFAGTKTNCFVDGAFLKLDPGESDGTYEYDDILDLGAVTKCRLTNAVKAFIENYADDFDSRTTDSDSWPSWDGAVLGTEADSWLEVSWTRDDPSGAPVWSEWERLFSSSFEAWGFRFRRRLKSYDGGFTPAIEEDAVFAEGI